MKSPSARRKFRISMIIMMTLFSFACRKASSPTPSGSLTNVDVADPNKTTGAENAQGLPYAGYNATQEISVLKSQIEDSDENKAFAQEIVSAKLAVPTRKMTTPRTQTATQPIPQTGTQVAPQDGTQSTSAASAPTTAEDGPQPLDLKVQMKGLDTPLDFQGTFALTDNSYHSNMVEISGQRPDLTMTAECTDPDCNHGNFFIVDPDGRKAGIVITSENRAFKLKTLADPIAPTPTDIPDELKQDQKVNISSVQVINGVSNIEIRSLDQNGKPGDVEASGNFLIPNGECPKLNLTDKAPPALRNLCVRGNSGDGDILLRGELNIPNGPDTPSKADASGTQLPAQTAPAQTAPPPPTAAPSPTKQTVSQPTPPTQPRPQNDTPIEPVTAGAHQYVYFESTRLDDTPAVAAQQQSAKPSKSQCPVVAKSENFLIKDIMADCNQPDVLEAIAKKWAKGRPGYTGLVRLISSANGCQGSLQTCDSANYKKLANALGKSEIPVIIAATVSLQESSFYGTKPTPGSSAYGWFQFVSGTAQSLNPPLSHNDLADITKSSNGFIQYFTQQLQEWDHDFKMALTSYNLGPGDSQKVETYGHSWKTDPHIPSYLKEDYSIYKDFWQIRHYCMAKRVGVNLNYAPEVLAAIFAATAPQAYNVDVSQDMEMK